MAKVNNFEFGSIVVDGKQYAYDVLVLPDGTVREREASKAKFGSHDIKKGEVEQLAKARAEAIIVGTGTDAMAAVSRDAQAYAKEAKLNLVVLPSSEAIEKLNELADKGKRVAALIHITC